MRRVVTAQHSVGNMAIAVKMENKVESAMGRRVVTALTPAWLRCPWSRTKDYLAN